MGDVQQGPYSFELGPSLDLPSLIRALLDAQREYLISPKEARAILAAASPPFKEAFKTPCCSCGK